MNLTESRLCVVLSRPDFAKYLHPPPHPTCKVIGVLRLRACSQNILQATLDLLRNLRWAEAVSSKIRASAAHVIWNALMTHRTSFTLQAIRSSAGIRAPKHEWVPLGATNKELALLSSGAARYDLSWHPLVEKIERLDIACSSCCDPIRQIAHTGCAQRQILAYLQGRRRIPKVKIEVLQCPQCNRSFRWLYQERRLYSHRLLRSLCPKVCSLIAVYANLRYLDPQDLWAYG